MSNHHSFLLEELFKSITYWFIAKKTATASSISESSQLLLDSCYQILKNGFKMIKFDGIITPAYDDCIYYHAHNNDVFQRLIDDFEFLRLQQATTSQISNKKKQLLDSFSIKKYLRSWILRCLVNRNLTQCLQTLINDKELLEYYYNPNAYLHQNNYTQALLICLKAIELNRFSLLNQLNTVEILPYLNLLNNRSNQQLCANKRTISQLNFSSTKLDVVLEWKESIFRKALPKIVQQTIQRVKSLPIINSPNISTYKSTGQLSYKTTLNHISHCCTPKSNKQNAYSKKNKDKGNKNEINLSSTSSASNHSHNTNLYMLPSTSASSNISNVSTDNFSYDTKSSSVNSNSSTPTHCIELINCDDIKIWTDQSNMQVQDRNTNNNNSTNISVTSSSLRHKKSRSNRGSPMHTFFSNLFDTPPTYTNWSSSFTSDYNDNNQNTSTNLCTDTNTTNISGSLFNKFLPINGRKLRQVHCADILFQDGISMLDYAPPITTRNSRGIRAAPTAPVDIITANMHTSSKCSSVSTSDFDESMCKTDNQSLAAFLQMSRCARNNTDLEKENAHFRISEVCISAIEHIKWAHQQKEQSKAVDVIGCDAKEEEAARANGADADETVPYAEISENYSMNSCSAEDVGLTLISKFNDKQLPRVCDLKWLVSEEDAPQKLLPLPSNYTKESDEVLPSITRGTKYWAPPRQQIIFTEHKSTNSRLELITKQNYRCAGCGMRVAKQYAQRFRYCTYLGKYHCTGCHRNQVATIPAKILQNWDFKCYPVSSFAYRLIEQMYTFPLFYVPDLNSSLYEHQKTLLGARNRRIHLKYVHNFIQLCRFAMREKIYFTAMPEHIITEPDIWSMSDFVDVHNMSMDRSIDELIALCEEHIFNCLLCTGRGFVCEYCNCDKIIYPWQNGIVRCTICGTCFHQGCWKTMSYKCCRCKRFSKRKKNFNVK